MVANISYTENVNAAFVADDATRYSDGYGSTNSSSSTETRELPVKLYKRRYFMLFLFSACTMFNGFQWIQFPIIASILSCYYHVSPATVNWTSILFMVMYVPFIVPVSWMMSVKGLRFTLIIGALGNSLTSCIQCVSLHPHQFYIVIISQTVAALAQVFITSMPSYVAAKWFGPKEVSTACAVGVFANQVGIALGFIIPPWQVPNVCQDIRAIRMGLWHLALWQAVANVIVYVLIVLFFEDEPPLPPSLAEARKPTVPEDTWKSLWSLLKNVDFTMLMLSGGVLNSVYFAISTMLNEMVTKIFPHEELAVGWMGADTVITGMFGALLAGFILDRTQLYWESSMVAYFLSLASMIAYTIVASIKLLWLQFFMFGLIGVFMVAYMPICYEFAAEITYPAPEGTSASLLIGFVSLSGVFITLFASWLQQTYSILHSNLFFCICLIIGIFIAWFVKCDGKRSKHNLALAQQQLRDAA